MEYEVYRHNDASDETFEYINQIFKVVLREDKDLCNGAQKNLNAGIFTNGQLHPRVEKVREDSVDVTQTLAQSLTSYKGSSLFSSAYKGPRDEPSQ